MNQLEDIRFKDGVEGRNDEDVLAHILQEVLNELGEIQAKINLTNPKKYDIIS